MFIDFGKNSVQDSQLKESQLISDFYTKELPGDSSHKMNIVGLHEKTELIWNRLSHMYAHGRCDIVKCGYEKDGASLNRKPMSNQSVQTNIYLSSTLSDSDSPISDLPSSDLPQDSDSTSQKAYITNTLDFIPKDVFHSTDFDQIGVIGIQKHLSKLSDFDSCSHSLFNFMRLADVRHDINIAEVILRETTEVVFDMNAIRYADIPDQNQSASTGLYMEEACQLMKYLGASSHLTSLEMTHINFENASESKYYDIISTLLWYFIEGMSYRSPSQINESDKKEYLVYPEGVENPIRFFNENLTNRWWCSTFESEEALVACSPSDYENAKNGRFSDRMMKILELY